MADEPLPSVPVASPAPEAAPAAAPAVVQPAVAAAPEPAPIAAPAVVEPAAPEAAPEPTTFQKLDAEKVADKPVEPAKPGEPSKAPEAEGEKPAAEAQVAAEDLKLDVKWPDTIKASDQQNKDLIDALKEFRTDPNKGAQKLIDMHAATMQEYATAVAQETAKRQRDVWAETQKNWRTRVLADPEVGGAGHNTAIAACARMRDEFISSAPKGSARYNKEMAEFQEFDAWTGASNHPAFLRIMHNVARVFDEPQAASIPVDIRPSKSNGRPPKGSSIYSHPSSAALKE